MAPRVPTTRSASNVGAPRPASAVPESREAYHPPRRPAANFIPGAEAIAELVARAQAALSRGILWERGFIINVLL